MPPLIGVRSPFGNAIMDKSFARNASIAGALGLGALALRGGPLLNPLGEGSGELIRTVLGVGAGLYLSQSPMSIPILGSLGVSGPVLGLGALALILRPELSTLIGVGVGSWLYMSGMFQGLFQSITLLLSSPLPILVLAYLVRPETSTLLAVGVGWFLLQGGMLQSFLPTAAQPAPVA